MNIWDIMKIVFWILIVSGTVFYFTKSVKRLFQVASGVTLLEVYNNLYDIGLWPVIQGWFGGYGALGLTLTALILNFIMLKWYQTCQTDWLGITVTDDVVKKSVKVRQTYFASKGLKKFLLAVPTFGLWVIEKVFTVRLISFLVISVVGDSFVATAFLLHRKNGHKNVALKMEDYVFFVLSTVFGCLVWTLFTEWVTLPAFRNVWQTFFGG